MAKKQKQDEPKRPVPEYMPSYADMVTVLFALFVLLFSFSTIDAQRFEDIANALASAARVTPFTGGRETVRDLLGSGLMQMPSIAEIRNAESTQRNRADAARTELDAMAAEFLTYFAEQDIANVVEIEQTDTEIIIRFAEGVLFDSGRAVLRPDAPPILAVVSQMLFDYPDNDILIEGHTDSDPINTPQFPSNWYLSAARAIAVLTYFVEEGGHDPTSIVAMGRGEFMPVAPNDTPENKALNRRVEIRVRSRYYSLNVDVGALDNF